MARQLIDTALRHETHLRRQGKAAEAEVELREAIAVQLAVGGPQSPDVAYLRLRLADVVLEHEATRRKPSR